MSSLTPAFTSSAPIPTISISPWFRGCIVVPDSLQTKCCTQLGSPPAMVNGTFGCPYNDVFGSEDNDNNKTIASFQPCCANCTIVCTNFDAIPGQGPFPGSISSATLTPTSTSATTSHSQNAAVRRGPGVIAGMLPLLFVLIGRLL
ncbi:hypothetical protein B0H19DRAFT_1082863 [Mycena capillaripes]|nr:hypothetical protein B0H19DRAFT_1082863 [Mycena capillaripes]